VIIIPSHADDVDEAALQRLFMGRFAALPGCAIVDPDGLLRGDQAALHLLWRQNVIGVKLPDRFVRAGVKGQGDLGGIIAGRPWAIELKRAGERQSKFQRAYHANYIRAGGRYVVARSLAQALVPVCQALGLDYLVTPLEAAR
jgi:hypothetical protein